jgi:hypothetical protein
MNEYDATEIAFNNGYALGKDVAREIFTEIEEGIKAAVAALQFENNPIHRKVKHETYSSVMRFVKTIEKKYTESEGTE